MNLSTIKSRTPERAAKQERRVRVLVIEDDALARLGITTFLNAQADITVIAEADTSEQGLAYCDAGLVDIVVLPLRLDGERTQGLAFCREVKSMDVAPKVLIYTSFASPSESLLAHLAGADSLLTKASPAFRFIETLYATVDGTQVWETDSSTDVQAKLLHNALQNAHLTVRETEVLGLMLQRYSNEEISRELCVELPTVKTHVSRILQKLRLSSRKDLLLV